MKPRNLEQLEIIRCSKQLRPINPSEKQYAFDNCLRKFAQLSRKTLYCLECGDKWKPAKLPRSKHTTCPHCGLKLEITKTAITAEEDYFAIVDTFFATSTPMQVIRMFYLHKTVKKYQKPVYYISEVMQHWQDETGKVLTIEKATNNMNGFKCDNWLHYTDLEFRGKSERQRFRSNIAPWCVHPNIDVLPIYKRNGFTNSFYGHAPHLFCKELLKNQRFETLVKAKQSTLVSYMRKDDHFIWKYWPTIKICIRQKYMAPDVSLWIDYLDLLLYFNKDINNPHYVCLPMRKLKQEHDRLLKKKQAIEEKRRIAAEQARELKEIMRLKQAQTKYEATMGKFFNIKLRAGRLIIVPLKSIEDFKHEADALQHCLFTNKYYEKENSLILSARINNEPIETIELSLKSFEIIQARGKYNQATEYHDKIIDLISSSIPMIADKAC